MGGNQGAEAAGDKDRGREGPGVWSRSSEVAQGCWEKLSGIHYAENRNWIRIKFQRDIRDCNLLCFTESWLNPAALSQAIQPGEFFSVHSMNRMADSGKAVECVLWRTWTLHCVNFMRLSQFQVHHQDAALIEVGDFNSANLKCTVPNLYQHVTFPTRGKRTLDHYYTPYKDSYKALAHPLFGKSDHAAIFLIPKYKQRLKLETLVQRKIVSWTDQSVATLQDALDDADWDMFWRKTDDVSKFMEAVAGFIGKLVDVTIPRATIKM
ncbi:hypothetical protein P4O66_001213 [Electrophorus voltai]|uniref:Uncharacterized protein n=1 Tax=Electrophorus voltai TaxID=2609070 RepID=A0AAD8ZD19_9TELE|nr:hypothetical protein P4O66_001213 [Electrophorus voltai]